MNFEPHEIRVNDVATVIAAFAAYVMFLCVAAAFRLGSGAKPQVPFNRGHLRLTAAYLGFALGALWLVGEPFGWAWLGQLAVGAFFYFGLHYAIFVHFFGIAQASVSGSIISIVYRAGGRATRADVVAGYAGGQGFDYIKRSRLARLEEFLGWVERMPGDLLRVTPAGAKAIRTTRFFLNTWSLKQLGGKP